jgi:hypothetical protein
MLARMAAARTVAAGFAILAFLHCGESEVPAPPLADCASAVASIASGFGARGPHSVTVETFPNPRWPGQRVSVHLPADAPPPVPVVLFAHANEQSDPAIYAALIDHIASRGTAVVFSPYAIGTAVHEDRYDALWSGFEAAVEALGDRLDVSRMGFVGHSYGAGALPFLAHRALREKGWGADGSLLYGMAPWYALAITPEQMRDLPGSLRVLIQVFEDDNATDHRIAIEQFHAIGVPEDSKEFVLVRSDANGSCRLPATHSVPQSKGLRARDDAIDLYGVHRLFDALAAYAFAGDETGRRIALGHGSAEQVAMGHWPDGTPVAPLVISRDPRPLRREEDYIFRHGDRDGWRRYGERGRGAVRNAR